MRVVVLGSGVIGVTTAYYLARDGHKVTVIDRQPAAAMETSHANAGQVSPGYSAPWAAPGIPLKALKWMLGDHSPLVLRPRADLNQWRWLTQMLANCNPRSYERNKGRMLRIAEYSRTSLQQLCQETGVEYDQRSRGTLQVFRTAKQLQAAREDMAVLDRYRVPYQLLDVAGCVEAEPALALVSEKIVGGLRLPLDQTGDCFKFTSQLAELTRDMGVEYRFDTAIEGLRLDGGRVIAAATDQGSVGADSFVCALGSYSRDLLRPLGLKLPLYPVKGYSITVPIEAENGAPVSTVMDETYKVAITRLGDRVRVGGTAELTGFDLQLRDERIDTLKHVVGDLFPQAADLSRAEPWTGLRPMTPDGTPIIGRSRIGNLFLNTGHGTLGWTMSCGSGRLLADLVNGRDAAIRSDDLDLGRYRRGHRDQAEPEPSLGYSG